MWFMPYRTNYRLRQDATARLLRQPAHWPIRTLAEDCEDGASHNYGHRFGAMAQMMPREAFELTHGMDPRFRGWGSEDSSFLRALDTLWGLHEVIGGKVVHLWHQRAGTTPEGRRWVGQADELGRVNRRLSQRYAEATGELAAMRGLVDEAWAA